MQYKICIDPGHGGEDSGAVWGFDHEDDINLNIAYLLYYELRLSPNEYEVLLTRDKDRVISLKQRCDMANEFKANLFISIHCDAFHNTTAKGMTVHIYRDTVISGDIGRAMVSQLKTSFPDHRNRGVKEGGFYVLKNTNMKAILVECEYLSNLKMRLWLHEPENQRKLAISFREAIDNYFVPN